MLHTLDLNKRYTYADYLTWADNVRRELIDGFIKLMSPAPNRVHQKIVGRLHLSIGLYLKNKPCNVFFAPFDVRFPSLDDDNSKIYTVVQPDICVICDASKLDERGCLGAPDLIIEILSPNNARHDVKTKFELYERYGVREYWIVYPYEKLVHVYQLDHTHRYTIHEVYGIGDAAPVSIFGDLSIDLTEVFEDDM